MDRSEDGQDLGSSEGSGLPSNGLIVYFSSVSEMTKNFVERVGMRSKRIPLRASEPFLEVDEPYILVTASYGAGRNTSAVPKQVIKFLNNEKNRSNIVGVAGSGSQNYRDKYCWASKVVSAKCEVPLLYTFELMGLPEDVAEFKVIANQIFREMESRDTHLA